MINFDNYTTKEIKEMILNGQTTNEEVVLFYGNQWWDDENK
jgi:hypothetical protein|tara:strand:- start:167 stop:289 length:123 start_codon:yes stop_codon:yes gene_type:complete